MEHQNIENNEQTNGRTYTFTEEKFEEMFTRFAAKLEQSIQQEKKNYPTTSRSPGQVQQSRT
jgi:hypothetical protein